VAEASSRGAVLLALEAAGKLKSIGDAHAPFVQIYEPDMERHRRYTSGLERQQDIYAHLISDKEIARTISEASRKVESADRLRCDTSIQQSEETS
jgi:hypothetical protein